MLNLLKNVIGLPFRFSSSKSYTLIRILFESLDQTAAFYIDRERKARLKERQKVLADEELQQQLATLESIRQTVDPNTSQQLKKFQEELRASAERVRRKER